jgi:hypothetical protein
MVSFWRVFQACSSRVCRARTAHNDVHTMLGRNG